jgi:hypothetical protein
VRLLAGNRNGTMNLPDATGLFSLRRLPRCAQRNNRTRGRPEVTMKRRAMALFLFAGSLLIGSLSLNLPLVLLGLTVS